MTGARDLCINEVMHQAFADVNEQGTEAAAATAVVMKSLAVMANPISSIPNGPSVSVFNSRKQNWQHFVSWTIGRSFQISHRLAFCQAGCMLQPTRSDSGKGWKSSATRKQSK